MIHSGQASGYCMTEGHMARQCTLPSSLRLGSWLPGQARLEPLLPSDAYAADAGAASCAGSDKKISPMKFGIWRREKEKKKNNKMEKVVEKKDPPRPSTHGSMLLQIADARAQRRRVGSTGQPALSGHLGIVRFWKLPL